MVRGNHQWLRRAAWAALLATSALFTGCASFYVDNGLRAADTAQVTKPAAPKPVQLFFNFKTKGSPNAHATQFLKGQVTDLVKQSGLFSELKEVAAPEVGTLQLTIDNIPLTDDAATKGFLTGLTLGLAGTTVGDGYACELQYRPSDTGAKVEAKASHAIYTSIGASGGPGNAATKVASGDEAIATVVRQAVKTLLVKLSNDPQFRSAP